MDIDPSQSQSLKQKAQDLQALTSGPLSSSISRLFGSSRALPSEKDFHFFYNFDEFKLPVNEIAAESQSMLETIGSSSHIWGKPMALPEDLEDAYDWLVNVNDEAFERFDMSVDEFQQVRKNEEETGRTASGATEDLENGFQMVYGKKKKLANHSVSHLAEKDAGQDSVVKVASRDNKAKDAKPKVPFHIPSIARPQDQFNILVNNSNGPFEHVWLEKSEDGSSFIHPLEKLSVVDFVDKNIGELEPINPPPVECTLFKFVQEVKDLKDLAAKLRSVDEFAVDLEHNHYRSFQGLTCLMQISTRNEDFVVDTLKLRIHIGPYLREVFKDPAKKKVMHGADRDIVWLQRDFGIYVCNLFDTGQASRVLKLERNSLEYLLHHFCGVTANKEYQNGDWRLRPLPLEMLRYAREDTHYLLHMYDLLRIRLVATSTLELGNPDDLLVEVYKRSYDVCMQLYEKELLTDSSYLYIYGLQGADFNAQQLSVVAGLYEWRDTVARAEDESTGYILPNKTLIEIAKQMPVTVSGLRRLIKSKHSYIGHNIGSVVSIIRHSIKNAAAFEAVAEQLKQGHLKTASQEAAPADESEPLSPHQAPTSMGDEDAAAEIVIIDSLEDGNVAVQQTTVSLCVQEEPLEVGFPTTKLHQDGQGVDENKKGKNEFYAFGPGIQGESLSISGQIRDTNADTSVLQSTKVAGATVQVLKKPNRAFGALLGKSVSKKNSDMDKKDKDAAKLEQIKSSMNLPFHSFAGKDETPKPFLEEHSEVSRVVCPDDPITFPAASRGNLEEIIMLEENLDGHQSVNGDLECVNERSEYRRDNSAGVVVLDISDSDEPMSLSDLSSSFKECFQSAHQTSKARQAEKSKKSVPILHFKPFDYDAARKQVKFGGGSGKESGAGGSDNPRTSHESAGKKKKSVTNRIQKDDGTGDFPQGKRRQAFPATGNRSATFR